MKARGAATVLGLLLVWSSPALAWEPTRESVSEPVAPRRDPDPAPFIAPPPGVYYVTDTYVADVVTSSGPLTTYSTATVHESTGSYARVLDTVGTGTSSPYDGSAFNGRRSLGDGRSVAGTYYENYVPTEDGLVPVSIVFFQDDAEIARLVGVDTPGVTFSPTSISAPSTRPGAPACCEVARISGVPTAATPRSTKPLRPGVSLSPVGAPLTRVEVLRGRAVMLWPRAFTDDREVPVRSWMVIAGDIGEALATAGTGGVPFRSSWRRLAAPGEAYEVRFRIEVDTAETGHQIANVAIAVVVRSPALQD